MTLAAALLIDSSNLYHALKKESRLPFGPQSFAMVFEQLAERYDLKTIIFYDALKDISKDPEGYARQQKFHAAMRNLGWPLEIKTRKLRYMANLTEEQARVKAQEVGIVDACREKIWGLLLALGVVRLTKEKGIDVLMAVDSIEAARSQKYGAIILLSGDADFVPAVKLIQTTGAQAVNLHPYHGSSTELRNACSEHVQIDFDEDAPRLWRK